MIKDNRMMKISNQATAATGWVTLSLLLPLLAVNGCFQSSTPFPAPEWQLSDTEGKMIRSSDFKGRVVILDFWATWCPPCRQEIPGFIALQKKYKDQGLTVIGVSVDEEGPDVVRKFARSNDINYPIVMAQEKILQAYGPIDGIPTTFVIDSQGMVVGKHVGYSAEAEFEREILPLLKNAKASGTKP